MNAFRRSMLLSILTGGILLAASASAFAQPGPVIDVWYGLNQDFGAIGEPQVWCDIQGNVSDPDGVALLSYTLNGGASVPMNQGDDGFRLENIGDFIVDLAVADLVSGANTVVISAEDALGNPSSTIVTVNYFPGNTWPANYTTDWGSLVTDGDPLTPDPAIQEQAHVVNGNWTVVGDSIRTVEPGFDRLVSLGDISWTNYEVTSSVIMNESLHPTLFGVGYKVRWQGHTDNPVDCGQPECGYLPLGEFGWIYEDRLELFKGSKHVPFVLEKETLYWMKLRIETNMVGSQYAFKVWKDSESEPDWMVTTTFPDNLPAAGSLMLVAHMVDASFGNVTVTEVTGINTPPFAVDDAAMVVTGSSRAVDILANDFDADGILDPGSVNILSGPFHGSIAGIETTTGVVSYLHDGGVALEDSFTYTVDDNDGDSSNVATVRLTIGEAPAGSFYSDDFNSCDLQPFWTFVDPLGDADPPFIDGAFTGNARLSLSVPGGSSPEPFGGVINAPYIIQDALDEDFILDVKWDSGHPAVSFAEQGIIIREDADTWLRFDFASQDAALKIVALDSEDDLKSFGTVGTSGDQPQYMRIERVGDLWTQSYSFDGTNWDPAPGTGFIYSMIVTGVGLFTGNSSANPAHTALVDYFSNAVAPVDITDDMDLNVPNVTITGDGTVTLDPDQPNYACGDPVQLTAVPGPGSVFTGWTGDVVSGTNPLDLVMNGPVDLTATFDSPTGNVVAANTSGVLGLSPSMPCATAVPIEITRDGVEGMRGFSLTLQLTNLDLCAGLASIQEGSYLNAIGTTQFDVTNNGGGSYQIDGTILGTPCGAAAPTGELFTVDVSHTVADGTGLIAVSGLSLFDCTSQPLAAVAGAPGAIRIDSTPPDNVTGLVVSQAIASPSWSDRIVRIDLAWTPSQSADAYQVDFYRTFFGGYPEYEDSGGSAPSVPTNPLAEGWTLIKTLGAEETTTISQPPDRDFYYFCTVTRDLLGNESTVVMSAGVPNYLLGDVSNGGVPLIDGDNVVNTADLTFLGAGYGTTDGDLLFQPTLDIGPTSDWSVTGRPTTDNKIDFEDLILFSLNYSLDATGSLVSRPVLKALPAPAASNVLSATHNDLPAVGETFPVHLLLSGAGTLQALQVVLDWDKDVVEPVTVRGGPLLEAQGGQTFMLSPEPGTVDLALAGSRQVGISGTGELGSVVFRVVGPGAPAIVPESLKGRDKDNEAVEVTLGEVTETPGGLTPLVTRLRANYPNPFNPTTTVAFDLVTEGRVKLSIYGVDGRLVRVLADEVYSAGRHQQVWDGRDSSGRAVSSGTYLYIMRTGDVQQTRRMMLLK